MNLEQKHIEFYRQQGYIVIQDLLSEQVLQEAKSAIAELHDKFMKQPNENEHIFEKDEHGKPIAVRCMHNLLSHHDFFKRLVQDQKMLDTVAKLMSPNILLYRAIAVIKKKEVGSAFPWHQDFAYWLKGQAKMLGCWIALKDATVKNGCLDVIPGSHKWGVLPMHDQDPGQPILDPIQTSQALPVPMKAGSALFFDNLLVHKSNPNLTDHDRWAAIFEFSAPEYKNGYHRFDRHCGWNPKTNQIEALD